jgi:hypothetical protein
MAGDLGADGVAAPGDDVEDARRQPGAVQARA